MRLWRRNDAPVGGWYYVMDGGQRVPQAPNFATGLEDLISQVEGAYAAKDEQAPSFIGELVEDQICNRQPAEKCRKSKKLGDALHNAIMGTLKVIDGIAKTNLAPRAKKCGSCGKRRAALNKI